MSTDQLPQRVEAAETAAAAGCQVEFCGEWFTVAGDADFAIGREGPLGLEDNPYLHRRFLEISQRDGWWWVRNVGSRLAATITASGGVVQAWLTPGGHIPLVFGVTHLVFSAGPTTYEVSVHTARPAFDTIARPDVDVGATTIGDVPLTVTQRALILALAEPMLRQDGSSPSALPTSAQAAERLGWALTRFNRKLDNVCEKFSRAGVRGLHGGSGNVANNRRARLVEYVVTSRLVTRDDLDLLEDPGVLGSSG